MDVQEFCRAGRDFLVDPDRAFRLSEHDLNDHEKLIITNYVKYVVENEEDFIELFREYPFPFSNRHSGSIFSVPFKKDLVLVLLHRIARLKFLLTGDVEVNSELPMLEYFSPFNNNLDLRLQGEVSRWQDFAVLRVAQSKINNSEKVLEAQQRSAQILREDYGKIDESIQYSINQAKVEFASIREFIDSHGTKLNFLGLSAAFESMYHEKSSELFWSKVMVGVLGILALCVPGAAIISHLVLGSAGDWSDLAKSRIFIGIPIIAIELVVLYFYRICLSNMRSLKAQIVQLRLRHALCGFLQAYIRFAEDHKDVKESLKRFEDIIFSSIVTKPDDIPSTFDGFDKISDLAKSMKS